MTAARQGEDASPEETQARRLLDELPVSAFTCDAAGLITWYNRRAVEIWGREPKLNDAADRFCGSLRLYATDGAPILHSQSWTALALMLDRELDRREMIVERPGGDRLHVLVHAHPLHDEAGRLSDAVVVLVDISERRRGEADHRVPDARAGRASEIEKLGSLAGGIAHDFNNLLTAVLGNASLAMISLPAESPARLMLREVEKAAREAAVLAGQMLGSSVSPALIASVEQPALVEGPRRDPTQASRSPGLVLVVDDSETVRTVAQRALQMAGFDVIVASDGIEAIETFQARREDVAAILLDLTMPRMHGLEAFKHLRAIEPGIPILVMSGYNEAEVSTRFAGMNATGFVQKPFRAQEVIARLTQIIPLLPRE